MLVKKILFVIISIFIINTCFAETTNDYYVENLKISKTDVDSSKARAKAITGAQREAFNIVLKRLNIETSNNMLISDDEILQTLKSMQIKKEKITKNSYTAIVSMEFSKDFVKFILSKHKLSKYSLKINTYLVVPILTENGVTYLWQDSNRWKVPFSNNIKQTNIKLIDYNKSIDEIITPEVIENPKYENFQTLIEQYNVNSIIFIKGKYNRDDPVFSSTINIFRSNETINAKMNYKINWKNETEVFDAASKKIINYINNLDYNSKDKEIDFDNIQSLKEYYGLENNETILIVPISNIIDYQDSKIALNSNKNVDKIQTIYLTKNLIKYKVKYKNSSLESFIDSLKSENISVSQKKDGIYIYIK